CPSALSPTTTSRSAPPTRWPATARTRSSSSTSASPMRWRPAASPGPGTSSSSASRRAPRRSIPPGRWCSTAVWARARRWPPRRSAVPVMTLGRWPAGSTNGCARRCRSSPRTGRSLRT
ncbi:MAG: hypothetical protein AVDCRST_MAG69-917, partial [uncultured Solirubrobacteraceae bacterium]